MLENFYLNLKIEEKQKPGYVSKAQWYDYRNCRFQCLCVVRLSISQILDRKLALLLRHTVSHRIHFSTSKIS